MAIKKSSTFDTNLDGKRMAKQIQFNLKAVGSVARTGANKIAPLDSGKLRNSATIKFSDFKVSIVWLVIYAKTRYLKNLKNPSTTRWAEKDYKRNKGTYAKLLGKDVLK